MRLMKEGARRNSPLKLRVDLDLKELKAGLLLNALFVRLKDTGCCAIIEVETGVVNSGRRRSVTQVYNEIPGRCGWVAIWT
jgi:hypothetical protein